MVLNNVMARNALDEIEKLEGLCKIWGYLKYYHPDVSKGKYDWDAELVSKISEVLEIDSKDELNTFYITWISGLGKLKKKAKIKKQDASTFVKNFDLSWITTDTYFDEDLQTLLKKVESHRNTGRKHYASQKYNIGNILLKNEKSLKNFHVKDYSHRLTVLFRYWNIVEYFFPAKYQMDENWGKALPRMIGKLKTIDGLSEFHLFLRQLIVKIDDGHAFFSTAHTHSFFGYFWPTFKIRIIQKKMIVSGFYNDSLAKKDELVRGDIITRVNGKEISNLLEENLKYVPASNEKGKYRDMAYTILNGSTDSMSLEIERNGELLHLEAKRYEFKQLNGKEQKREKKKWIILDKNIGYANLGTLNYKEIDDLMEAVRDTDALILDMRNGVDQLWGGIGKYLKSKRGPFVKILKPDLTYPGKYTFAEIKNCCMEGAKVYQGKVILLVDENVQSHGEFTCMAWQTGDNVTTVGSQTAGADGQVTYISLGENLKTRMTGVGIFYPDGTETQRKGVRIDVHVNETIQGIKAGKDEILEKAIDLIFEQ